MNWTEILGNGWAWAVALVVVGAALMWFGRREATSIGPGRAQFRPGDVSQVPSQPADSAGSSVEPAMAPAHEHSRSAGHRHRHGCC